MCRPSTWMRWLRSRWRDGADGSGVLLRREAEHGVAGAAGLDPGGRLPGDPRADGHAGPRLAARRRADPPAARPRCASSTPTTCRTPRSTRPSRRSPRTARSWTGCAPTGRSTTCCATATGPSGPTTTVTSSIETLRYLDLKDPANNDLLAVQQMWVKGNLHSRRLDVALFVNGVPLVLMEFKEPNEPVKSAYDDNLTDYRDTIPQLFIPNCFVLLSNGSEAKVGSTYSPWEFFGDWKVIDAAGTRGAIALETALRGTCDPAVLLDLFENFVAYMERPGGLIKVARALPPVPRRQRRDREPAPRPRRAGQAARCLLAHPGLGQVLSMLWFTQKVLRQVPGKWTFVMVTDRTELDTQLHGEFADAGAIPPEAQGARRVHRPPARAAGRRPPLRLHADPEVPAIEGSGRAGDAGAVRPLRRHRHHRRGPPQPVRHPRAQHAPRAAQRLDDGLHRHPADRRRGAGDARAVRRLRQRLQLPRRHRGRRDRPALLREPHPRAAAGQRELLRRARRTAGGGRARRGRRGRSWPASSARSTRS